MNFFSTAIYHISSQMIFKVKVWNHVKPICEEGRKYCNSRTNDSFQVYMKQQNSSFKVYIKPEWQFSGLYKTPERQFSDLSIFGKIKVGIAKFLQMIRLTVIYTYQKI